MGQIIHNFTDSEISVIYDALQEFIDGLEADMILEDMSKKEIANTKKTIQLCQSAAKPFYDYLKSHGA